MLAPVTPDRLDEAIALLDEGFPERGRGFWSRGLARLAEWHGNAETGFPLGFFWLEAGHPVGIVLTPASRRLAALGEVETIVNVSSWFIRPDFRWKAPLMLRALFRKEGVIFTDLTPSPEVQKMLPAFGFSPVNAGILLLATPWQALQASQGWQVRAWHSGDELPDKGPDPGLIGWHVDQGCLPLVLEKGAARHLLLCRPFRYRQLPAVETLFVGSHAALRAAMPALSRYMLRKGILVLQTDVRAGAPQPFGFRPRGIWFARGGCFADRTDHLGSELCLLDL